MASSSEPRPFPYTNDVGNVYHNPEKPPIEEEPPTNSAVEYPSPITPTSLNTQQPPMTFQQPHYAPITPTHSLSTTSLNTQPPPFIPHQPQHALTFPSASTASSAPKLTFTRFTIPTKNAALSSGFPYDPRVYNLISHDEWHLLSSDIVNGAKLSFTEDFAAWTTGVTTGTLTSPFILIGAPWAGYYAGRAVHRKTVVKVVKERLDRDGDIRSVLRRWNEQKFIPRGFQAWLELPVDGGEISLTEKGKEKKSKKERKAEKEIARRFRIAIVSNSETLEPNGTPAYAGPGPWSPVSPVSPADVPLVEALGNEFRDPVEAMGREHRDPVELGSEGIEEAPADETNSTPARSEVPMTSENRVEAVPRSIPWDAEGVGIRSELE